MGLDMYLTAKRHLSQYSPEEKQISEEIGKLLDASGEINEVSREAGYWRKANAIHNWFVKTVQDGVDECQEAEVDIEQLRELLAICDMVLADVSLATEILPPAEGFFFGGTEIDEYYTQDLKDTKEILEKILNDPNVKDWTFYYQSSW